LTGLRSVADFCARILYAALRAAQGTLMEAVPLRLKPAALRVFLEVLSKPAGAVPELTQLLRGEAPWESEAEK
jgi:uncharacterized protein (DUF1778 family)